MRFRVLVADCPWKFGDSLPGKKRGAQKHYDVLPVEDLERFPIPEMEDDSVLFLWRVAAMQEEALRVVRAWGFVPKSEMVWVKTTPEGKLAFGMGRIVRAAHETCLVATRGRAAALVRDRGVRSVFLAPRGEHSAKPEKFFELAERLFPGPYAELFARGAPRPGWTRFGREAIGEPERP